MFSGSGDGRLARTFLERGGLNPRTEPRTGRRATRRDWEVDLLSNRGFAAFVVTLTGGAELSIRLALGAAMKRDGASGTDSRVQSTTFGEERVPSRRRP